MAESIKITTIAQLKIALQAVKTYINGEIDGLGALASKSEIAYNDLAAALKTLIDGKAEKTTVNTLIGEDTGKSVRAISAEEVAKVIAGAPESFDTLKEIADWIQSDTTGAAKMAADIDHLDAILDGIGGTDEEGTVVAYVQSMIDAIGIGDYVKTATMTTELNKKVDKVDGSRLMTSSEGTKLAGIEEGANKTVIYDGLDSPDKTKVLSAAQGKALNDKIVAINTDMENKGAGDMLKSVYDVDCDGVVDNASKLGGFAASAYAKQTDLHTHANKAFLDSIVAATDTEVTAVCTEVFGA